jgi:mannosylfructose-phosphate synthase
MKDAKYSRIAMLSTHGYFDPEPILGRTDTGGQVVYVLELAKALARQGIKVDIYTRWFNPDQAQIDPVPDTPDVRVIRIKAGPWEFIPKEFIYEFLPELTDNMETFIKEQGLEYDLYHGHYVDAGIVTVEIAKRMNKPSYFTPHSLGAWKKQQMGGDPVEMEKKFNFKLRIAEEINVFNSVKGLSMTTVLQYEKLKELYDYDADNIVVIAPGVDIHRFHPPTLDDLRIQTELPEKYIFCLSRIDTNKGHDLLLEAYAKIQKQIPDIDLVIGGGSPNPKPRELGVFEKMHSIIDKHQMKDRVHILGYVADEMMVPYYQQSMFFVLPSLFEPFGMTVQEAMACGKAVIASKYGGIRNVITHQKNGILADAANADEFGNYILDLSLSDEKREKMGIAAYQLIRDKYSWEAISGQFLDFFDTYQ